MAKKGFWPVGTMSGAPWQGSLRAFDHGIGENAVFVGDVLQLQATGNVNAAAAGNTNIVGVCVGILPYDMPMPTGTLALAGSSLTLESKHMAAATNARARILACTAPDAIYRVRTSGSALTMADVGLNTDHLAGAGVTATGLSGHELNTVTGAAGTPTAGFRILGPVEEAGANIQASNAEWLVVLNEGHFSAGKAGI